MVFSIYVDASIPTITDGDFIGFYGAINRANAGEKLFPSNTLI
jgi:hypothetical protein